MDNTVFNDFFIRKKNCETQALDCQLISPADAKISVYKIYETLQMKIKNTDYTLPELFEDTELAGRLIGGVCLVFRLSLTDYHRYVWVDDGVITHKKHIKGVLHTVRSISSDKRVYVRNTRGYRLFKTKHLGDVICMEVGAMLVGKINNHQQNKRVKRMQEKGFLNMVDLQLYKYLKKIQ